MSQSSPSKRLEFALSLVRKPDRRALADALTHILNEAYVCGQAAGATKLLEAAVQKRSPTDETPCELASIFEELQKTVKPQQDSLTEVQGVLKKYSQ